MAKSTLTILSYSYNESRNGSWNAASDRITSGNTRNANGDWVKCAAAKIEFKTGNLSINSSLSQTLSVKMTLADLSSPIGLKAHLSATSLGVTSIVDSIWSNKPHTNLTNATIAESPAYRSANNTDVTNIYDETNLSAGTVIYLNFDLNQTKLAPNTTYYIYLRRSEGYYYDDNGNVTGNYGVTGVGTGWCEIRTNATITFNYNLTNTGSGGNSGNTGGGSVDNNTISYSCYTTLYNNDWHITDGTDYFQHNMFTGRPANNNTYSKIKFNTGSNSDLTSNQNQTLILEMTLITDPLKLGFGNKFDPVGLYANLSTNGNINPYSLVTSLGSNPVVQSSALTSSTISTSWAYKSADNNSDSNISNVIEQTEGTKIYLIFKGMTLTPNTDYYIYLLRQSGNDYYDTSGNLQSNYTGKGYCCISDSINFTLEYNDYEKCSPPTMIAIETDSINENSNFFKNVVGLLWSEMDSTNPYFNGYELSYRDGSSASTLGNWISPAIVLDKNKTTYADIISSFSYGQCRQYRVRTLSSLGEEYHSDWLVANSIVCRNTPPTMPSVFNVSKTKYKIGDLITLSWETASDVDNNLYVYRIRFTLMDKDLNDISSTEEEENFLDSNVSRNLTSYKFNIPSEWSDAKYIKFEIYAYDECHETSSIIKSPVLKLDELSKIHIYNGTEFKPHLIHIHNGTEFKQYSLYIHDGTTWQKK